MRQLPCCCVLHLCLCLCLRLRLRLRLCLRLCLRLWPLLCVPHRLWRLAMPHLLLRQHLYRGSSCAGPGAVLLTTATTASAQAVDE